MTTKTKPANTQAAKMPIPSFSSKTLNAIVATVRDSSEPLTAAEIHVAIRENYGVNIAYQSLRSALARLIEEGRLIRREETDRERQIRTTETRGPNSFYFGAVGYPIPARTRGELPTDPKRNENMNRYYAKKRAEKKAAAKKVRPASKPAVQTAAQSSDLLKRIAELEAQNAALINIIDKLLK